MRHNPGYGIMTEFIECGPMPIDRFEISLWRRHLHEIAGRLADFRGAATFGVRREAIGIEDGRSAFALPDMAGINVLILWGVLVASPRRLA